MLAAIALTFGASMLSCDDCISGNGEMTSRTIKIGDISQIRLSADADVLLVSDSTASLKIEGESNIIDAYELKESGKTLKIRTVPCILSHKQVKITIPVHLLEALTINGSGNIVSQSRLRAMDLELGVNGSGDIDLDIEADNLVARINGSGDIKLKGSAKNQRGNINGSGDVEAEEFAGGKVSVTINGSGDCRVMATSELKVVVRGSGSVYYKGSPDITTEIKGSGTIEKIE